MAEARRTSSLWKKMTIILVAILLLPVLVANLIPEVVTSEVIFFNHISADSDSYDRFIVKTLVTLNPRSLKHEDSDCRTPLYTAAGRGNLDLVKFLIAKGANVNPTGQDCGFVESVLDYAVSSDAHPLIKHEIVKCLLNAGAQVTETSLRYARDKRDYDLEGLLKSYRERQDRNRPSQ